MPVTVLGTSDTAIKNQVNFPTSRSFYFRGWKQLINKIKKKIHAMHKKKAGSKDRRLLLYKWWSR